MTETRLSDLAAVIRSKNAGPFVITLDVFFKDNESFEKVRGSGEITAARIARLYRIQEEDVLEVAFFQPAIALKISFRRWVASAAPGDTDVFGAQQHVPLLNLKLNL